MDDKKIIGIFLVLLLIAVLVVGGFFSAIFGLTGPRAEAAYPAASQVAQEVITIHKSE